MKLQMIAVAFFIIGSAATAHASEDDKFDRALTKQEIARLLPKYLKFIEERATDIPSPEETARLRQLGGAEHFYGVFDKNNNVLPGQQTHTMDDILKESAAIVEELKKVSVLHRLANTNEALSGFHITTSKISCKLGHLHGFNFDDQRIVQCEDNHSTQDFGDVRSFRISIDAKTLEPLGVLTLDWIQAG